MRTYLLRDVSPLGDGTTDVLLADGVIAAIGADAAQSAVLDQVSAGVAVRMSVLYHLLAGEGSAQ